MFAKKKKKMKPLQQSYQRFVVLGICPQVEPISRGRKIVNAFVPIFCPTVLFITCTASFLFFMKYVTTDLERAICACLQIAGAVNPLFTLFTAHIIRSDIKKSFDYFQMFHDKCKLKKKKKILLYRY